VGGEFERHVLGPHGSPAPYFGRPSISGLLDQFNAGGNWRVAREGPHIISLLGDVGYITLEPGAQLELSGFPYKHLASIERDARIFSDRVDHLLADTPMAQSAIGFTPFADIPDIPWVPKGRYVVMRAHLGKTGRLSHHMMKGTAATQASYDFSDEVDCARKVSLATAIAPIITAWFANSPYSRGRLNGWASYRGYIWTETDPARTGLPDAAAHFDFERWIDYLLDAPMMFVKHEGRWLHAHGATFRDWMLHGLHGRYPTRADWDLHQTSVFPEVRVKRQIEVRMADCVTLPLAMAFIALFKGLFYSPRSLQAGAGVAQRFSHFGTRQDRFVTACKHGLRGVVGGRPLYDWAEELLEAASDGLAELDVDEQTYLESARRLIARRASPAHLLIDQLGASPSPRDIQRATHPLADPSQQ
jgi:glutamate--cysteine ligase